MGVAESTDVGLRLVDVLDVLIVSAVCWVAIAWVRESRVRVALGGVAIVSALYGLASFLELRLTTSVLQGFIAIAALVLVVVFQDDLRRFFEGLSLSLMRNATPRPGADVLDELGTLCFSLASARVGTLFVLPGREPIDRFLDGGHYLGGRVSEPLLRSLLDTKTPGHDGAIVIRGGQVARFGVHLPLSTEFDQLGAGGTRHAAALGLAERSDAFCIVVSEERGVVSVAWRGRLIPVDTPAALRDLVEKFLERSARRRREPWVRSRLDLARRRWREGVLATALASGLWVLTGPGAMVDRTSRSIPVVVENVPDGYRVASVEPAQVDVEFEGRRRDFVMAPDDGFAVRVDGDLVDQGRRTFAVDPEQVEHPPALRVVGMDPIKVRLDVESL
ncbi:MAG: diadenylate cyclase [bacterium]|nr:diadenylate cyclase [bacterium]